ncbi:ROK family protein [Spiroplasma endosymbiont of Othius punctulatus]|uniref:ROK family protein n=1 Tax=Spiroplasma endosymbiont of Othius punctulatus TaxID=3066289 RepID=UPI0030D064C0
MNLCFDLGGTSTKVAFFKNEKIVKKETIEYNQSGNIESKELLKKLVEYIESINDFEMIDNICISSSGLVDSETGNIGGLSAIKNLSKINFINEFKKRFKKPVYIENDGKCATLAEITQGNGVGSKNLFILVLGTGIGGGIVIDGKIHKGSNLIAGDVGYFFQHNYNGKYTNLSEVAGMYFLTNKYEQISNTSKSGKEIYDCYLIDKVAKEIIDKQILNLARAILNVSFTIDVDKVLIGGAISANELFLKLLNKKVSELYAGSGMIQNFKIDKCKFLNDSNLIGANQLVKRGK